MIDKAILLVLIIAVLVLVFIRIIFYLKALKNRKEKKVRKKFEGKNILHFDAGANFFGIQSVGMGQVRGNGVLVLTDTELFFEMWAPTKELSVPVSHIKSVESVKIFLGKTKGWPLVRVNFQNENGRDDAAAWLVGNPKEWIEAIQGLISKD